MKSTVEEIRNRFENDVERFSNLETGQSATVDATLVLDLVTRAAAATTPAAERVLDIGCGAGNYAIKLLRQIPRLEVDLLDLSPAMLERARSRVADEGPETIRTILGDIREVVLEPETYDIVLAAATLHHLRSEEEWERVFKKIHRALEPGGSFWISDLVEHSIGAVQSLMRSRYGDYLVDLNGEAYRDEVFAYIEKEDTPRPLAYQVDLLGRVGFRQIDILHKNSVFAAFGGVK